MSYNIVRPLFFGVELIEYFRPVRERLASHLHNLLVAHFPMVCVQDMVSFLRAFSMPFKCLTSGALSRSGTAIRYNTVMCLPASPDKIAAAAILYFAAIHAVSAQLSDQQPKFEVASVRLTTPLDQAIANRNSAATVSYSGARVTIDGFVLKTIIATAYRTETYLVNAPDWTAQARVVIQALMPEGGTKDQLPEMLKALLAERFHLVAHTTAIEEPVFALVIGKNGPKLNLRATWIRLRARFGRKITGLTILRPAIAFVNSAAKRSEPRCRPAVRMDRYGLKSPQTATYARSI
jgi:hypothetical protein